MTIRTLIETGAWTPAVYTSSTEIGSYDTQEGWYARVGDTVAIQAYVRATFSASSDTVSIRDLPFSRASTVTHVPAWIGVTSLASGSAWPRFASDRIFLNDSGDNLGVTDWTFSSFDFYLSVGAIYRISS